MCRVISFVNNKGGVGKTTSCASLGYGLAENNFRVLLIDADPLGSLTRMFGINKDECEENIYAVMKQIIKREEFEDMFGIQTINGIDILPSSGELNDIDVLLPHIGKENILKRYVYRMKEYYDYILIDCQPAINNLVINSLVASDSAIIPVKADVFSYDGLEQIVDLINQIVDPMDGINTRLRVDGVLMTIAKKRTKSFNRFLEQLKEDCGDGIHIFESIIPDSIKGADVSATLKSIYEYDKNCSVALAYKQFTNEIIELGGVS